MTYENAFLAAAVAEFRGIGCQGGACYPPRNRFGPTGGRGGSYPKGMPSAVAAKIKPGSRKAKQWAALEKRGAKVEKQYNRDVAAGKRAETSRRKAGMDTSAKSFMRDVADKPKRGYNAQSRLAKAAAKKINKMTVGVANPITRKGKIAATGRRRAGD